MEVGDVKAAQLIGRREETIPSAGEVRVLPVDHQLDLPAVGDRDTKVDADVPRAFDFHILTAKQVGLVGEDRSAVSISDEGCQLEKVVGGAITVARGAAGAPRFVLR